MMARTLSLSRDDLGTRIQHAVGQHTQSRTLVCLGQRQTRGTHSMATEQLIRRSQLLFLVAWGVVFAIDSGCSRHVYRKQADREADEIVAEKQCDQRWLLPDYQVYPDPRSRYYDPYDPDRPPMPPDDPAAHRYMHCVDKHKGYKKWHKDGDIANVENPCWQELLPSYVEFDEEGKLKLDLQTALLLARLHSRSYQNNLEEIYLSALDVAYERFRFEVQFFGGTDTTATTRGNRAATLGALSESRQQARTVLDHRNALSLSRQFTTGGELLAGFANSFVWQFTGNNTGTNFATSILDFTLVQPLLRNAGKDLVLEQLTRAERNLLSNLRAQAQYRQEFFRDVAFGGGTDTSPQRIGGFQGGAGLSGFTGTGQGGFAGVGAGQGFGSFGGADTGAGGGVSSGAGLAGGGEGLVSGFYGLAQRLQGNRNTEASLASQMNTLGLLEANFAAGLIDLVQVDEFRQNIETERSRLLQSEVSYQDTLESYLVSTLGLPPWTEVEIDDSLIKPFQLIDPAITALQNRATDLLSETGRLPVVPAESHLQPIRAKLANILDEATSRLDAIEGEYQKSLAAPVAEKEDNQSEPRASDTIAADAQSLKKLRARLEQNVTELKNIDQAIQADQLEAAANRTAELIRNASAQIQEMALLQARVRLENIRIDPIELDPDQALAIAATSRLDWMNRRASLVDQWRLIAYNANRLESDVDVVINGELGTLGDNPTRFRHMTGTLSAQLVFDAPLTRKEERNLYREALIDYQQAKRSYIVYTDRVAYTLRSRLRQLQRLRLNLEIQRRALAISIRRVDQTLEDLNEPFAPPQPGQPPTQLGPTLAQNLLRALSDLRTTQDAFMSVWLSHEAARLSLAIELGTMRLDEQGRWIDEPIELAMADCPAVYIEQFPDEGCLQGTQEAPLPHADGSGQEMLVPGAESTTAPSTSPSEARVPAELPSSPDQPSPPAIQNASAAADSSDLAELEQTHRELVTALAEISELPEPKPSQATSRGLLSSMVRKLQPTTGPELPAPVHRVSREQFAEIVRHVRQLSDQGLTTEQIAQETGHSVETIRACQKVVHHSDQTVIVPIPSSQGQPK